MKRLLIGSASIVALISLSGCGGGGGGQVKSSGSAAPIPVPAPEPAPAVSTPIVAPTADPAPAPVVAPAPVATPTPVITPDPVVTPVVAPTVTAPVVTPVPIATPDPAPTATAEPTPVAVTTPAAPPVTAPVTTPVTTPTTTPPVTAPISYANPVAPPAGYVITPAAKQPVRSANDTPEYRANFVASELVNGLYALDSKHSGQGVVVAVTDDGAVNVKGELDGRISSLSKDFGYVTSGGIRTKRNSLGDEQSDHGTAVTNIIGAAANGVGSVGYAPNATIAILRISDWNADTKTETLTHVIEAMDYAGKQAIKVVNSSLGFNGSLSWGAAVSKYALTGGLVVKSAGNTGEASPIDSVAVTDANRQAILFVGALRPLVNMYQMESYSNLAGTMMERYVVAPGRNVTTDVNGASTTFAGTSSAAPVVTGLVADILSKWPQLSGQQAGNIVINTAKDIGDPGVDAVYGHGLVDFNAALAPVNPTLSNGATQTSLGTSTMTVPDALGSAAIQTALSDVTVLDQYGRDYRGSVAALVVKPQLTDPHRMARRMHQMGNQVGIDYAGFSGGLSFADYRIATAPDAVQSQAIAGSFGYTSDGFGIRAAWNAADSLQSDVMGLAPFADGVLAYVPQADSSVAIDRVIGHGRLGLTMAFGRRAGSDARAATLAWTAGRTALRVSLIDEQGTIMGVPTGAGALRLGRGARTMMVEAHRTVDLARSWQLEGYGSVGMTRLKIDTASLVTGATPLIGSRFGVQATRRLFGGQWSLGIAQPLKIEAGAARLTYASGYDLASQSLVFGNARASLAGARRLQLTTGFAAGGARSSLRVGMMRDLNDGSVSALGGWTLRM